MRDAKRNAPAATAVELTHGLPIFLDQLREALRRDASRETANHGDIDKSASQHGHDLFDQGLTVAQVVHDYGDLCQVITLLAVEQKGTTVSLKASTTTDRVLIEVADECGGLPPGQAENLLQPFIQQGPDRSGLGLGLSICLKAVKAIGGDLRIRDLPRKGCVFTIDLPKQPPPPSSIYAARSRSSDGPSGSGGALGRAVETR